MIRRASMILLAATVAAILVVFIQEATREQPRGHGRRHVHVDKATGCQYIAERNGSYSRRISADGKHLGCRHA